MAKNVNYVPKVSNFRNEVYSGRIFHHLLSSHFSLASVLLSLLASEHFSLSAEAILIPFLCLERVGFLTAVGYIFGAFWFCFSLLVSQALPKVVMTEFRSCSQSTSLTTYQEKSADPPRAMATAFRTTSHTRLRVTWNAHTFRATSDTDVRT